MGLCGVLAAGFLLISCAAATADCRCNGCGCKGGPGFRGPTGHCVSYKQLDKVCGLPLTTRCTFEHHKQKCEHEGSMPDKKGMEHYRHSIEGLTH